MLQELAGRRVAVDCVISQGTTPQGVFLQAENSENNIENQHKENTFPDSKTTVPAFNRSWSLCDRAARSTIPIPAGPPPTMTSECKSLFGIISNGYNVL